MGNVFDDLNADNQFIEHDKQDEIQATITEADDFFSLVVKPFNGHVSLHLETEMGDITPVGLFRPESKAIIQEEINSLLTKYPKLWIQWDHKEFEGVTFQIRRGNQTERFFRTGKNGMFQRRKVYAERNPDAVVSFIPHPEEQKIETIS
tara:strand:- start:77 stop:523 length:447 start_codon:yes stop_codon:yes gene_type:complete